MRHLQTRKTAAGQDSYRFRPSTAMSVAGFRGEALGMDYAAAAEKVKGYNAEWDVIRKTKALPDIEAAKGDVKWLIARFEKDPTWYGALARATQDEIDYAFRIFAVDFGHVPVAIIRRRHLRAFYNDLRIDGSIHKARKVMKWVHRLFSYALEMEVRDDHPMYEFKMVSPQGRDATWTAGEARDIIMAALSPHRSPQGNIAPPRPSIAHAVQIALDSSLPQQDILALGWGQYDGEGLTVRLKKKRGGKDLWIPLSNETRAMLDGIHRTSTHIIVNEMTQQPYKGKDEFGRVFRKVRQRAGILRNLTFHDFRTTALTNMGAVGATNTEIVAFSGHDVNSPVLKEYVLPDRRAALLARKKLDGKGK